EGEATLGDKKLPIYADGYTVTIPYSGLELNTEYTLTIPARLIGNANGGNDELTYTFRTTAIPNLLFYSDFNIFPREYFDAYYYIPDNENIIAKSSTDVTEVVGPITFYSGTKGRVVALKGNVNGATTDVDYGPHTDDDFGASNRAVQLLDGGRGLYVEFPELEGPLNVTMFLCSADGKAGTVLVTDETGDKDRPVATIEMPAAKRMKKIEFTYPYKGTVALRLYNETLKLDINDIFISKAEGEGEEKPGPMDDVDAPVVKTTYPNNQPYAGVEGKVIVTYNEPVFFGGKATIDGRELDITTDGATAIVEYAGLENGKTYTAVIPAAADEAGNVGEPVEVTFTTIDAKYLYFTDFANFPVGYYEKFNDIPNDVVDNKDILTISEDKTATNQTVEVGGITYFSGTAGRIVAMGKSNLLDPANEESAGASQRCIQVKGGNNQLYLELPEVTGPCKMTFWVGNSPAEVGRLSVRNAAGAEVTTVADLSFGAEKVITKYVVEYAEASPVRFRLYNLDNQFNIHDIIVEKVDESGVETISIDATEAVYYNLQGVRVANPAGGIYIRVSGDKATKVYVK
ncbi:MAG: hypothetical protein J1E63_03330, partial [Muribaculaceae bacterium]|nr:hypothetical protein [Muribaculaceae bacterium]